MPLPDAPGHARISIKGHWTNGNKVVNVLDMRRELGASSWTAITRDVLNNWQDEIMDLLMNNYTLEGARYIELIDGGETGDVAPDPAKNLTGQRAGTAAPPNVAYLVHKHIASHRGVHQGRWYVCGAADGDLDENGELAGSIQTDWATKLDAFWSGIDDADKHPSVVHFDGSADDIESFSLDPVVATMRRRVR